MTTTLPLIENRVPGLVSVIIGAYNSARHIGQTIDTVLAQTYHPVELIVVDDGSSDKTWEVLQSYGDRIIAIKQANGGVPVARNTGLSRTKGEFIALMDHDDLCMPERLALQVALLKQQPEVSLCCTEFSAFNDQGPIAEVYSGHYYSQCAPERGGAAAHFPRSTRLDMPPQGTAASPASVPVYLGRVYDTMACGNFVHPPTVLFRASLLNTVGGFDVAARLSTDWDWLVRAARVADFAFIDRPLLNYRRSSTQISSERYSKNASLDTIWVAEQLVERDPDLWQRQQPALRALLAELCQDAAYANAEARPWTAIQLLIKTTLKYRTLNANMIKTMAKALTPNALVALVRRRHGAALKA